VGHSQFQLLHTDLKHGHHSAFFNEQIYVTRIYAHTSPRTAAASAESPITQQRRVHLLVGPTRKLACIATSTVHLRTPAAERLFLEEQHAIGQCFRTLGRPPQFVLASVDVRAGSSGTRRELARTYTLETDDLMCEIEEVFPDRDMFDLCRTWLEPERPSSRNQVAIRSPPSAMQTVLSFLRNLVSHRSAGIKF
jgi:hypothetical protein